MMLRSFKNIYLTIDYIYKKLNILKFNDLKKVYMLNHMYNSFYNNLPNIIQVKYIKRYTGYSFRNDKLFIHFYLLYYYIVLYTYSIIYIVYK